MTTAGVRPNAHSCSAVINSCAKAGDVKAALWWFEAMRGYGITPDVVVFSGVLDACAKAGDVVQAKQVFQQMQRQGITPNVVAFTSLARPFAHTGQWQEVEVLAQQIVTSGLVMNEYFLYTLLLSYATAKPRQAERAASAFRDAVASGVEANTHVLAALSRAVGRPRAMQLAQDLCPGHDLRPAPRARR